MIVDKHQSIAIRHQAPPNTPIDQPFKLRLFVENVAEFSSVFEFSYATDVEILVGCNWLSTLFKRQNIFIWMLRFWGWML